MMQWLQMKEEMTQTIMDYALRLAKTVSLPPGSPRKTTTPQYYVSHNTAPTVINLKELA